MRNKYSIIEKSINGKIEIIKVNLDHIINCGYKLLEDTNNPIFNDILETYIKNETEWASIFELITDSIHVIELIHVFMFDTNIAANLSKESRQISKDVLYNFKKGFWSNDDINISNPITFIKHYCNDDVESEEVSLWFFMKIAFLELSI